MRICLQRREFIAALGSAAAWPSAALGQQSRTHRIGVLAAGAADDPNNQAFFSLFQQELRNLGWTAGQNIQIEARWGGGETNRVRAHAAELVRLKPDLLVAFGVLPLTALQRETRAIPMVFSGVSDPVEQGFVASLARPGGNITGTTLFEFSLPPKLLEALHEIVPGLTRVTLLYNPDVPSNAGYVRSIETAARSRGIQTIATTVVNETEIEPAIEKLAGEASSGLIVLTGALLSTHRRLIVGLTARHHLPTIYTNRVFVDAGGLMSYGTRRDEQMYRIVASYVSRILRGENPADLPVVQPTKFEFVINLKAAKALGLEIPLSIRLRADELIE
jgi:putative ABC transport system substrate-binding protein